MCARRPAQGWPHARRRWRSALTLLFLALAIAGPAAAQPTSTTQWTDAPGSSPASNSSSAAAADAANAAARAALTSPAGQAAAARAAAAAAKPPPPAAAPAPPPTPPKADAPCPPGLSGANCDLCSTNDGCAALGAGLGGGPGTTCVPGLDFRRTTLAKAYACDISRSAAATVLDPSPSGV